MNGVVLSITAAVQDEANRILRGSGSWPTAAAGLASKILQRDATLSGGPFDRPVTNSTAALLRRTPELSAYGYVIDLAPAETVALWVDEIEHLRGREIYPADRNSFIFNPVEILGVSFGLCSEKVPTEHREWLAGIILRGFSQGQFKTNVSRFAALSALHLLDKEKAKSVVVPAVAISGLPTHEVIVAACIDFAIGLPGGAVVGDLEQDLLKRLLSGAVSINDEAEAAALLILVNRVSDRISLSSPDNAVDQIVALCRRFPLFAERLRSRQQHRAPFEIKDEYDVQDLLHAILKLHFDDVRPEEHTPSYAGSSSRVDFHLPKERVVVEAKMTRASLGQKEVANQLIIDANRYRTVPGVETLICLVYDPEKRCQNPTALERDVEASGAQLCVKAVVCPQGL
ncbi:transposase [Rhodopseudomonas sp. AAP120]|uniref:PD-(D/E)XK nuclease domain-containing protein n=1 Tax=Rhodopseudomonas sp. AAP120 TaxID=1523430 RepID=UPI000A975663|nr:transposase [Rhodopseudomonas sp. AAP120]